MRGPRLCGWPWMVGLPVLYKCVSYCVAYVSLSVCTVRMWGELNDVSTKSLNFWSHSCTESALCTVARHFKFFLENGDGSTSKSHNYTTVTSSYCNISCDKWQTVTNWRLKKVELMFVKEWLNFERNNVCKNMQLVCISYSPLLFLSVCQRFLLSWLKPSYVHNGFETHLYIP